MVAWWVGKEEKAPESRQRKRETKKEAKVDVESGVTVEIGTFYSRVDRIDPPRTS